MYWLDNDSGVASAPAIPPAQSLTRRYFTEGGSGEQPSIPGGEWFNAITDELLNVLSQAGITPDKSDHSQLAQAIQSLASSSSLIGVPIPWPLSTPPADHLMMMGQAFSRTTYPELAIAYPSLTLPDLRAGVIRGWDNGRGVDTNRVLLSAQTDAVQNATGFVLFRAMTNSGMITSGTGGVFGSSAVTGSGSAAISTSSTNGLSTMDFDLSRSIRTATETRMRNIAYNYIVRAA